MKQMAAFVGEITQIPPMYSAVKVTVDVYMNMLEIMRQWNDLFARHRSIVLNERVKPLVKSSCGPFRGGLKSNRSKGTHVRTLAVDTGSKLGYPAHMSDLTRTASAGMDESQAMTLAEVASYMENGTIEEYLLPIETGVAKFKTGRYR